METSDDKTLRQLCVVKQAALRRLQAENTRLHLRIVRARAAITRLEFEQDLLQERLGTAGRPAFNTSLMSGSGAHSCRLCTLRGRLYLRPRQQPAYFPRCAQRWRRNLGDRSRIRSR
jgi:hypothetical protein